MSIILASAHPVSLVLLWVARTVRLHAVLVLRCVSTLAHVSSIVNKCQGLVFHRLTHRQQQLGQLGNISTWLTKSQIDLQELHLLQNRTWTGKGSQELPLSPWICSTEMRAEKILALVLSISCWSACRTLSRMRERGDRMSGAVATTLGMGKDQFIRDRGARM